MAKFATQISHFLLIAVLLYGCRQCDARNGALFSKHINLAEIQNTNKNHVTTSQISTTPTSAPAPAPSPVVDDSGFAPAAPPESGNLYSYKKTYNAAEDEDNEFTGGDSEGYSSGHSNSFSNVDNAFWTSNYRSYRSKPQGMSDTRLAGNDRYYYNNPSSYTRLAGNDKYYYNNPSSYNRNYTPMNNKEGYYYADGQKSRYEFNSMEEYERQEGYPNFQQDHFFP